MSRRMNNIQPVVLCLDYSIEAGVCPIGSDSGFGGHRFLHHPVAVPGPPVLEHLRPGQGSGLRRMLFGTGGSRPQRPDCRPLPDSQLAASGACGTMKAWIAASSPGKSRHDPSTLEQNFDPFMTETGM